LKILLIDDDYTSFEHLSEILDSTLFTLQLCRDLDNAVIALRSGDYDAVVANPELKGMKDLNLAELVQRYNPNAFVILTGNLSHLENAILEMNGIYAFFLKPFDRGHVKEIFFKIEKEWRYIKETSWKILESNENSCINNGCS